MKNHQTKTTETKNKCLVKVSNICCIKKQQKNGIKYYTVTNMVGKMLFAKSEDLKYCYLYPLHAELGYAHK